MMREPCDCDATPSVTEEAVLNPDALPEKMRNYRAYRVEYGAECSCPEGFLYLPPDVDPEALEALLRPAPKRNESRDVLSHWGVECGEGWKGLYQPVIDAAAFARVSVYQIKEKFGQLRIYLGADAPQWLDDMVTNAECLSNYTCETCGRPGRMRSSGGWMTTRCDEHAA